MPSTTAASAPGMRRGRPRPAISAYSTTPSAASPAIGASNRWSSGSTPSSATPTPPIEPSRPACGATRRIQSPAKAAAVLTTAISTITAMPTCQVSIASWVASQVGPSTATAMPTVDGVSRPSGIAVMSARPVAWRSRIAIQV